MIINRKEAMDTLQNPDGCTDLKNIPPVETEQSKTTETMLVDGEPTEIDLLSYEVGYTHGQSERPKGEKKFFETEDSFKVVEMTRCLITEGYSVRIEIVERDPMVIGRGDLSGGQR